MGQLGMMGEGSTARGFVASATLVLAAGVLAGCGGERGSTDQGGDGVGVGSAGGASTSGMASEDGAGDDDGGMLPPRLDTPDPDSQATGGDECASFSEEAELESQPADIIFIVDNSGSMVDEAQAVQNNLNGFSTQIIDSGVDVRVVLISAYPNLLISTGICVEPPLGSGGCPMNDNNPPRYSHISDMVNSNDALQKVIGHHGQWGSIVRDDAALHFVVVTDDESDLGATDFDMQIRGLEPMHQDYVFHGIISACTGHRDHSYRSS